MKSFYHDCLASEDLLIYLRNGKNLWPIVESFVGNWIAVFKSLPIYVIHTISLMFCFLTKITHGIFFQIINVIKISYAQKNNVSMFIHLINKNLF